MMRVVAVLALVAFAAAQQRVDNVGDVYSSGSSTCDEARTWSILNNANDQYCGSVLYNPKKERCCGGVLRSISGIPDPNTKDASHHLSHNSRFCWYGSHVATREYVCGGEVFPTGTWDAEGKKQTGNQCCNGQNYVASKFDSDGKLTAAKQCCNGVIADATLENNVVTTACCAEKTYKPADEVCCGSIAGGGSTFYSYADAAIFTTDTAKTCCGVNYVEKDADSECCGGIMQAKKNGDITKECCGTKMFDSVDADGYAMGACCNSDNSLDPSWATFADLATGANGVGTAGATDNDRVWTAKKTCGCRNEWIDISKGKINTDYASSYGERIIQTYTICGGDKDKTLPCLAAKAALAAVPVQCCGGTVSNAENGVCIGSQPDADGIYRSSKSFLDTLIIGSEGTPAKDYATGRSYNGVLLRNGIAAQLNTKAVDGKTSHHVYNDQQEYVESFCGGSSAVVAVTSAAAAVAAVLAF